MIVQMSMYLVNALSVHASLSPPNPPVKRQYVCTGTPETDTLFERVVQHITFLSKVCFPLGFIPLFSLIYFSELRVVFHLLVYHRDFHFP